MCIRNSTHIRLFLSCNVRLQLPSTVGIVIRVALIFIFNLWVFCAHLSAQTQGNGTKHSFVSGDVTNEGDVKKAIELGE